MHWVHAILFASDATLLAVVAGVLAMVALLALLMDWRRANRRQIDAVGLVPWTSVFMLCSMTACILLTLAVAGWMAG